MGALGKREIFSRNLRHYIDACGKDRRELAEIWGFPYSTVSEWISGRKYPRIDKIEVMADYFKIQMSDLIEDHSEDNKEAASDGLTDGQRALIEFARSLTEEQAVVALRLLKSLVEAD